MIPQPVRLYNPKGPDHIAVISVQPASAQTGSFLIQLARGSGPGPLKKGTVFGPFPEAEIQTHFTEILSTLKTEGFIAAGLDDLLKKLLDPKPAVRARAALNLGWRRAKEGVEPILAAMPKAVDDVCSFLDALGGIGDERAIPILREQAERKLLSRRRSAVEAIRNLPDAEGLNSARQHALQRLPDSVRSLLESFDQEKPEETALQQLVQAVLALKVEQCGLALDTLYEVATPLTLAATRRLLTEVSFDRAHLWRYVKSIHKRAMLRHDYDMWGWLSHAIEMAGRSSTGCHAFVKSGYDGVQRQTRIFGRKTQHFMRRLSWRFLKQIARHRPESYTKAAAEALVPYTPEDGENPHGLYGQFSGCYLLNRILWGSSKRLTLNEKSLRFRFRNAKAVKPPALSAGNEVREEAYPQLWDAYPYTYLRLLGAARLPEVQAFAVHAVETRHMDILQKAEPAEVLSLLQAPYEPTAKLGLTELERRFDPQNPDWGLLHQLLRDDRPGPRELGERWLRLTFPLWINNLERILAWLTSPQAATRAVAAELTITSLRKDAALRLNLAKYVLDLLRKALIKDDVADGIVRVAREALLEDFGSMVTLQELIEWFGGSSRATLPLAGELLARRGESVPEVGVERLAWLAQHDVAAVRLGAHQFIRRAEAFFRDDAGLLLTLAESTWEDTRKLAVDLLRVCLKQETLGLDGLLGFLDSNQVEVQNLGQELARVRMGSLPTDELVFRLVQHPHPNMRRFALDLVLQHLPDGAEPLARLESFFRSVLFDLWPQRAMKKEVLVFLAQRGLRDAAQAAVVVRILGDVVRIQGRSDFERALETLVRLKIMYPEVASPVSLPSMEGVP